jgi:hypothetical protein
VGIAHLCDLEETNGQNNKRMLSDLNGVFHGTPVGGAHL